MNIESKVNEDVHEILGDEMIKVRISEEFDIPEYVPKGERKGKDKRILVLSGGGIKGIAHVGVLNALHDIGVLSNIHEFAGTSAGTLAIALYLVGYTPKEQIEFIMKFDLSRIVNINFGRFLQEYGLDDGRYLEYVVKRMITAKGHNENMTLLDLYTKSKKRFNFTTVCWNTMEIIYMNHENFPNLPVWKAIRMSTAIPFFYTKVNHEGLLYMDGGCIDNYPIQLYTNKVHEVIGIYLDDSDSFIENPKNLEEDWYRTYEIIRKGANFGCKKGFEKYTISINFDDIIVVKYNIDKDQKEKLYRKGYDAVHKIFG